MEKKRKLINLTMFDLLKGIGIILVILRHSRYSFAEDTLWDKMVLSFVMPAFFIMSGYWLKPKKAVAGIKYSAKYALKPYCYVAAAALIISFVHRLLIHNISEWFSLYLVPFLTVGFSGTRIGAMWFVWTLFLTWVCFYCIINIKEERTQWAIVFCIAFIGSLMCKWITLPYQILQTMIATAYVYFGYQMKKKKLLEKKLSIYIILFMLALWCFCIYFGAMDLALFDVRLGIVDVLGSLCGAFLIIKLSVWINQFELHIFEPIMTIGRYTLWILCLHSLEMSVVPWRILFRFVEQDTLVGNFVWVICRCIFIFIGCCFLKNWPKIKKIIGRKK